MMRKALPRYQTETTQKFTSLDNRELSIDLRMNLCPRCVALNEQEPEQRNSTAKKDRIATSKSHKKDKKKKKRHVTRGLEVDPGLPPDPDKE